MEGPHEQDDLYNIIFNFNLKQSNHRKTLLSKYSKFKHDLAGFSRNLHSLGLHSGRLSGIFELDLVTWLEGRLAQVWAGGATEGVPQIALSAAGLYCASLKVLLRDVSLFKPIKFNEEFLLLAPTCAVLAGFARLDLIVFPTELLDSALHCHVLHQLVLVNSGTPLKTLA